MTNNITQAVADFLDHQDELIEKDTRNYIHTRNNNTNNKEIINYTQLGKGVSLNGVAPLSVGTESSVKKDQGKDLPNLSAKWRTIKLDLFNNSKDPITRPYDYTLKVNIYLYDKCQENNWDSNNPIKLQCKFNDTSLDSFNIGIIKSETHYKQARQFRDQIYVDANQLGIEHISLNKFYIPTKDKNIKTKSVKNFSGLLIRDSKTHTVVIFKGKDVYQYTLSNNNLSMKQRKAKIIGSCIVRAEDSLQTVMKDAEDFL